MPSIFTKPLTWFDGIRRIKQRGVMPTTLGTEDLRRISGDVKRWATFSAKVTKARALGEITDVVHELVRGVNADDEAARARGEKPLQLSFQDAKLKIQQAFEKYGVKIDDPTKVDTIEDFQSDARLSLIVDTQEEIARGHGKYIADQDDALMRAYPAQELIRVSPSEIQRDWKDRWQKAGGQLVQGRMVALKNSSVWQELGSTDLFDDALGNPYPPFAFNSGMGVKDISRREAIRLGLTSEHAPGPKPDKRALADDVAMSAEGMGNRLRNIVASDPDIQIDDRGVLRLAGRPY